MTVIFDLDGTLLDTPGGILHVARLTATELGLAAPPDATIKSMIGKPLVHMFSAFEGHPAAQEQAVVRFRELFSEHVVSRASELVFPGIVAILDQLSEDQVLAIATSKILRSAEEILSAAGLLKYFEVVAGADSVSNPKPAPDMALHVASRLGARPADCTVIGDSIHDMGMAVAAGMQGIGVTWGVDSSAALSAAGASVICRNPTELYQTLSSPTPSLKEV